ncbi:HD domain-containing protein [Hathewaya massiliensis]|uniref:HD domain-containing protein n=1 Tax=Hathewaya massiliensis TaxID=1964382 RepID=UPI0011584316|nr:HD domain-containing protein [Hathewaya massiliensis]
MHKRIKQFIIGTFDTIKPFSSEDKAIINNYLDYKEVEVFNTMKKYDKSHCLRVTKSILSYLEYNDLNIENKKELIKASLIHDIGKRDGNFYIINRGFIVILVKVFKNKKFLLKYKKFSIYVNHPEIGYNILKESNLFSEEVLYIVKNHHKKSLDKSLERLKEEITLLQRCDDEN